MLYILLFLIKKNVKKNHFLGTNLKSIRTSDLEEKKNSQTHSTTSHLRVYSYNDELLITPSYVNIDITRWSPFVRRENEWSGRFHTFSDS